MCPPTQVHRPVRRPHGAHAGQVQVVHLDRPAFDVDQMAGLDGPAGGAGYRGVRPDRPHRELVGPVGCGRETDAYRPAQLADAQCVEDGDEAVPERGVGLVRDDDCPGVGPPGGNQRPKPRHRVPALAGEGLSCGDDDRGGHVVVPGLHAPDPVGRREVLADAFRDLPHEQLAVHEDQDPAPSGDDTSRQFREDCRLPRASGEYRQATTMAVGPRLLDGFDGLDLVVAQRGAGGPAGHRSGKT